jgi:D-alanyl-D-alanine carboxypeptidase (penicillin-binding protein 5/6)
MGQSLRDVGDRRLLAVVMGAPQKTDRYKAVTELLNMGFTQFERVVVLQKGFTAGDPVPVLQGKLRSTHLVASDNVVVLVKKGQKDLVRQEVNISAQSIQAPAPQGASFGEVTVFVGEEPVTTVDLVLEEVLEKGSLIDRVKWWIVNKISL